MSDFFETFGQQVAATSIWEWVAVALAIAYILLAIKENIWCWVAAFFSTAIYTVLFYDVNLFMESLLNVYYLLMAVYGFYQWRFTGKRGNDKPISRWSFQTHLSWIVGLSIVVLISGYLLDNYTTQDFAYIDSFTTWFAVFTTYLLAKKVLENWLYWVVIDFVSVFLYWEKGLLITAILFIAYTVMAIVGWLEWKKHYAQQTSA